MRVVLWVILKLFFIKREILLITILFIAFKANKIKLTPILLKYLTMKELSSEIVAEPYSPLFWNISLFPYICMAIKEWIGGTKNSMFFTVAAKVES